MSQYSSVRLGFNRRKRPEGRAVVVLEGVNMYGRSEVCGGSLGPGRLGLRVLLVLLGGLFGSAALAQSGALPDGSWGQCQQTTDPTQPIYISIHDTGGGGFNAHCYIRNQPSVQDGSVATVPYAFDISQSVTCAPGAVVKLAPEWVSGSGFPQGTCGWPGANITTGSAVLTAQNDGEYYIRMDVGGHNTDTFWAWIVGGQWTTKPPQGVPPTAASGAPPGWSVTPSVINVNVGSIPYSSTTPGNADLPYVVNLTGPASSQMAALQNTSIAFSPLPPGTYTVVVHGIMPNTGAWVTATTTTVLAISTTVNLSVTWDVNGVGTWGAPTTGSGSGGTTFPGESWWEQLLQDAFVPDQTHLSEIETDGSAFLNWGPFMLIQQLYSLYSDPVSSPIGINYPAMGYEPPNPPGQGGTLGLYGHGGCGCWVQIPNSTGSPMSFNAITSAPLWGLLRGLMGAGVYVIFAIGVMKWCVPKQTI